MSNRGFLVVVVVLAVAGLALAMTNPGMSEYQTDILKPAAQQNTVASDAMLASILSSLPAGTASDTAAASDGVHLLTNRTVHHDYIVLSVYETAFEFCPGSASRMVTRTVGVAGRFYTWSKGGCMAEGVNVR